ncbi:MAG: serine/threonine-protein kinase, partial [Myxococcaceae bacterium]
MRQATATFSRRRLQGAQIEGAPYQLGDVVCGRYEIRDAFSEGPVGIVFRAYDREIDIEVALKVVNARLVQTPEERKQFARLMRLARKLSHQNLIRVYEEGEDQDRPFYTMQVLEGLTLRKIIDLRIGKGEFFKLGEIEPILGQIAHAMDAAHKLGPHGNLKPENVIVLPDLLKVGDYGLSLGIPRLPFVQAVRQRKADRYLAPEYVAGGEVDQRADIYALGVIVGEMLSGLTPDESIPELIRLNPEVPPALEGLYRRSTNSNPLVRPKTASEFFDEFVDISRRVSPPPLKTRPELAAVPAVPRPRTPGTTPTVELRKRNVESPPPPPPVLVPVVPGPPSDLTQP